jgi:hypothetical protein
MKNTKDHGNVKHIDIQHHYFRELLHSRSIAIEQVSSTDNLADLLPGLFHAITTTIFSSNLISIKAFSVYGGVLDNDQSRPPN